MEDWALGFNSMEFGHFPDISQFPKAKKEVILFPEIGRVIFFLSPTRQDKSNVYENICFLFQKTHTKKKKISASKFSRTNLRFFPFVFQQRKVLLKCKLYLKNSIKLIYFFCGRPNEDFFHHLHSGNK